MTIESSFVDSVHFDPDKSELVFFLKGKPYGYPVTSDKALTKVVDLALKLGSMGEAYNFMVGVRPEGLIKKAVEAGLHSV